MLKSLAADDDVEVDEAARAMTPQQRSRPMSQRSMGMMSLIESVLRSVGRWILWMSSRQILGMNPNLSAWMTMNNPPQAGWRISRKTKNRERSCAAQVAAGVDAEGEAAMRRPTICVLQTSRVASAQDANFQRLVRQPPIGSVRPAPRVEPIRQLRNLRRERITTTT